MDSAFSPKILLELSDSIRQSIDEKGQFSGTPELMGQLSLFLDAALSEELHGMPSLELRDYKGSSPR